MLELYCRGITANVKFKCFQESSPLTFVQSDSCDRSTILSETKRGKLNSFGQFRDWVVMCSPKW